MAARPELVRGEEPAVNVGPLRVLTHIEPAARDVQNAWLAARGAIRFQVEARELELVWSEPSPRQTRFGVELACGAQQFLLALDSMAAVDPLLIGEPFELMPVALRDVIVLRLLARFLTALPASLANAVDVRAVHWRHDTMPTYGCMLGFSLARLPERTESHGLLAASSPQSLAWLHEKLPAIDGPQRQLAGLRVPLFVVLGRTALRTDELRSLRSGDLMWIETARIERSGLAVAITTRADRVVGRCRLRHRDLSLTTIEPHAVAVVSESTDLPRGPMAASLISTSPGDDAMSVERAVLEVPVTFDIGELVVTLQDLERLQPGHVFELQEDVAEATIRLRVAGSLVAEGKLVAVGKRIGVRIAKVLLDPHL